MLKSLRKRFILFSVYVISSILMILGFLVYLGPSSDLNIQQILISMLTAVFMVFAGSYLLSKAAIRPIQNAWQKQLDFTADASHELRTPLSVIQTNLELVMDNPNDTVQSQMGIFFIPVILILPAIFGLNGVIYAQPIADLLTVLTTLFFAFKISKELKELEHV